LDRFAHQSIWGVIAILILILCSERRVVDSTLRKVDWNASEESPPSLAVISLQLSSTETHFRKENPSLSGLSNGLSCKGPALFVCFGSWQAA